MRVRRKLKVEHIFILLEKCDERSEANKDQIVGLFVSSLTEVDNEVLKFGDVYCMSSTPWDVVPSV